MKAISKKGKLISLFIIVILTFVIGMRYELDYRILTRKTVKYVANYKLGFYGGKDFRFFKIDIAFILTLIPIGFYFIIWKMSSLNKVLWVSLVYMILIPVFYYLLCFLESQFIHITITDPIMNGEILKYHQNNVNYRMILFFTILSTFISGIVINRKIEYAG